MHCTCRACVYIHSHPYPHAHPHPHPRRHSGAGLRFPWTGNLSTGRARGLRRLLDHHTIERGPSSARNAVLACGTPWMHVHRRGVAAAGDSENGDAEENAVTTATAAAAATAAADAAGETGVRAVVSSDEPLQPDGPEQWRSL